MDFNERVFDYTYKICECLYDNLDCFIDINLDELIHDSICSYFELCGTKRSEVSKVATPKNKRACSKILKNIKIKDTHEQGTAEWFDFRWNHITASSAWKAFEENASKNQLILSKCQPINPSKYTNVNITSATHHGHKYEPVSILIYEEQYDTEIGEYGCIESDRFSYLAASPDGINTKIDNCRYGRLLEVKNPTSRKITGIPKKEYWVQMQIQMEVLNLDTCDFLETLFKEYETGDDFSQDGEFSVTKDGKIKGIIVCLNDGSKPVYKYKPLNIKTNDEFDIWKDAIIDANPTLTWINDSFWHLETLSCVLVKRNKQWFETIRPKFLDVWKIILRERAEGYDHRKPKKRAKNPRKYITAGLPPPMAQNNAYTIPIPPLPLDSDDETGDETSEKTGDKLCVAQKQQKQQVATKDTACKQSMVLKINTQTLDNVNIAI